METKLRLLSCKKCGNETKTELLSDVGDKIPFPKLITVQIVTGKVSFPFTTLMSSKT